MDAKLSPPPPLLVLLSGYPVLEQYMPGTHQGVTVSELRRLTAGGKGMGWGGEGTGRDSQDMHMPGNMQRRREIKETPHHSTPGEK